MRPAAYSAHGRIGTVRTMAIVHAGERPSATVALYLRLEPGGRAETVASTKNPAELRKLAKALEEAASALERELAQASGAVPIR